MESDQALAGLQDAGFSEYEAEAYLALLERGTSKAVDVARRTSLPVPRIYDVVKDLEQRGYVETLERDTLHVRATEPIDLIDDLHCRSERLARLADHVEEQWEQSPIDEHDVNVTKRAETAIDHARERIREAEDSVDIAASGTELVALEESLQAIADEDVVVRLSVYQEGDDDVLQREAVRSAATEIRERTFSAPLLAVVDSETTYYAPTTTMPDPFGVIVTGDIITLVFRWYFQTVLWTIWDTAYERGEGPSVYVNLEEFIVDAFPAFHEGAEIAVRVEGVDTHTGAARSVEGTLVDVRYTGDDSRVPEFIDLAGEAAIVLDGGDGTHSVGSWEAQAEDIAAYRIAVEEFREPA